MHGTTHTANGTAPAAHDLAENILRGQSERQSDAVAAVRACHSVGRASRGRDADGHGLLSLTRVGCPVHQTLEKQLLSAVLEGPDFHHDLVLREAIRAQLLTAIQSGGHVVASLSHQWGGASPVAIRESICADT